MAANSEIHVGVMWESARLMTGALYFSSVIWERWRAPVTQVPAGGS